MAYWLLASTAAVPAGQPDQAAGGGAGGELGHPPAGAAGRRPRARGHPGHLDGRRRHPGGGRSGAGRGLPRRDGTAGPASPVAAAQATDSTTPRTRPRPRPGGDGAVPPRYVPDPADQAPTSGTGTSTTTDPGPDHHARPTTGHGRPPAGPRTPRAPPPREAPTTTTAAHHDHPDPDHPTRPPDRPDHPAADHPTTTAHHHRPPHHHRPRPTHRPPAPTPGRRPTSSAPAGPRGTATTPPAYDRAPRRPRPRRDEAADDAGRGRRWTCPASRPSRGGRVRGGRGTNRLRSGDPDLIEPGETITSHRSRQEEQQEQTHTVRPGRQPLDDRPRPPAAALRSGGSGEPTNREVAEYWAKVVEANRDGLQSGDPDLIYPGEEIVLPPTD